MCSSQFLYAQVQDEVSVGKWRVGFNLGLNYSNIPNHKSLLNNADPINGFGFRLGGISEYKVSQKFCFSPKLDISFNGGKLKYTDLTNKDVIVDVSPIELETMLHMKYTFGIIKDKPFYILVGPNFRIPFNDADDGAVLPTTSDIAIDFGFGFENHYSFFTLIPEVRYSYGFKNISKVSSTGTLQNHNVALVFNFL